MRRSDTPETDPDVLADLDAIDATLAGEPVDPSYAELAELALLLAHTVPRPEPEFASDLDRRVARRFEPLPSASAPAGLRPRLRLATAGPGLAVVVAAAVAVVVVTSGGFNSAKQSTTVVRRPLPLNVLTSTASASNGAAVATSSKRLAKAPTADATSSGGSGATAGPSQSAGAHGTASLPAPSASYTTAGSTGVPSPVTGTTGKVIQSAQISLTTPNAHVNAVSEEIFQVVANEHGTVKSSQVTAATTGNGGGSAYFTLSVPTGNLQTAMTQLSRLHFAAVDNRTDGTQSVSSQYSTDQRNLKDAQALRTSLLKQLQSATSQTSIDSIEAQLKTANSQITSAQSTLGSLNHRISDSTVTVQLNSNGLPIVVTHTRRPAASGFTIHRAGHDALRVLVVSAGVALITLAVLVPVGLLLGLLAWIALGLRQRRREHTLDTA